jgi:hypothetical protein
MRGGDTALAVVERRRIRAGMGGGATWEEHDALA